MACFILIFHLAVNAIMYCVAPPPTPIGRKLKMADRKGKGVPMQTVMITGGSGFIGANLVRMLVGSGTRRVVNLDLLTYAANPLSLADLEKNPDYIFAHGDICDRALV